MTVFLGIGTGRCGSTSLCRILNQCIETPPSKITHEDVKLRQYPKRFVFTANAADMPIFGDIAAYWLPRLDMVRKTLKRPLKLVLMVRDMEPFIQSLEKRWDYNKFTKRPRTGWLRYIPYTPGRSIRDCAAKYWKDYNAAAIKYDPFILRTEDLNNDDKLTELYDYLELTTRVYPFSRRYNVS